MLVALVLASVVAHGQINSNGLPILRNYTPEEYEASDQNWSAVQDHRGVMYFGNNDNGVLEYDGKTWRKIPVPQNAIVRSLNVDSAGTVYVGTVGDFGYLAPNKQGTLQYNSLLDLLVDSVGAFSDIYKIHLFNNKVHFFNRSYLFIYDGQKVDAIDINPERRYSNLLSFLSNNRYYIGSYKEGLRELTDTSLSIAPNGAFFKQKNIWGMTPSSDSTATMVTSSGLYKYNQQSGNVTQLENNDKFFGKTVDNEVQLYYSFGVNKFDIGISFLFDENIGFAQLDSTGLPKRVLSKKTGLFDETVTSLYQNKKSETTDNPLWLPLNVGITRADIHSPINRFSEESGIRGGINSVLKFNGKLVVLTMSGAFYQDFDNYGVAHFRPIDGINSASWSYLILDDSRTNKQKMLIGTITNGIYEVDENFNAKSISHTYEFNDIEHIAYSLHQCKGNPSVVYIGMSGSFAAMKWQNGRWKNLGRISPDELKSEYRHISSANPNELWLITYVDGVQRIRLNGDEIKVDKFNEEHGLSTLKNISSAVINGKVYFSSNNGIVKYNNKTNTFEPAVLPGLNQTIEGRGVYKFVKFDKGYALSCYSTTSNDKWIEYVEPGSNGEDVVQKTMFKALPSRWSDELYVDENEILWMSISTELFSYNKNIERNYNKPFNALIRRVKITGDSVIFNGSFSKEVETGKRIVSLYQQPNQNPALSFSNNNISFDVASSFYEFPDRTEYSFFLDGYDKEWSKWNSQPSPIYTNLREGSYTFKVKARNVYGTESKIAEYSFTIHAPWYRTILAYIVYLILAGLLVWGIVIFNTRRLIAEKIRLEEIVEERTAEVVAQKEELEEQRDKIFEQNEEIKSSINYASRIQNALLTPVETINEIFNDYFILYLPRDIVSGDFYWHTQFGNRKICVVADCTGHGVPGGFMSMLGIGFLTQIMTKGEVLTASQILDKLRQMIIESLHQTGKTSESKDGMDLALYIVDTDKGVIEFAGANNPLVIIRDNEIIQIKGDKMPIGIHIKHHVPFTNHIIEYKKGDVIYTFSDGYPDQFGGPKQRKFMIKNLKDLLLEIHKKPMPEQKEILLNTLLEWQGDTDRIDDIVLMGLRL